MKAHTKHAWLVMVGCLVLAGCKDAKQSFGTVKAGGATGVIDAVKLCDDYKAGQSTADSTYKGKDITVKGTVLNVRPDPATKAKFAVLKGSDGTKRNVRCYFVPEAAADVEKLKKDDVVTVHGTCEGAQGSTTGDSFDIEMKSCKLVK